MPAEQILLVNPRRRKRRHSNSRRKHRHARANNPRRRHRRHMRHSNPRHHRRRHRNPRFGLRGVTSYLMPAITGAAGAVLLDVGMAYLPIPDNFKTGWLGTGAKAAGAVGLGLLAGKFLSRRTGALFTAGALTVIAYQAVRQLAASTIGTSVKGLSGYTDYVDYRPSRMGAYMDRPATLPVRGASLGYMNPAAVVDYSPDGMGAYMNDGM